MVGGAWGGGRGGLIGEEGDGVREAPGGELGRAGGLSKCREPMEEV